MPFDTVNHSNLLYDLESCFNVKDKTLFWFNDYLSGRQMKLQVNNKISCENMWNVGSLKVVVVALYYLLCM